MAVYCLWSIALIAQKPGLQYDEALLVSSAVRLLHRAASSNLQVPAHFWICPFSRYCLPLMTVTYVGAAKDYVCLPLFALFAPGAGIIRLASMVLGAVGIWGMCKLAAARVGAGAGLAAGLILAVNAAYVNMTVFDNNAVSLVMAAFGVLCAGLERYRERPSPAAAWWIGVAAGFGLWARANFLWTLAGVAGAGLIVFRSRFVPSIRHSLAMAAGAVCGGMPLVTYEIVSHGATWKTSRQILAADPMGKLLRYRLGLLADTFVSDLEHHWMWSAAPTPAWQLSFFLYAVGAACIVCLIGGVGKGQRRPGALFAIAAFAIIGAFLFFSRLQVAAHHIVAILPFAALVVVSACSIIRQRFRRGWMVAAALALVYGGCAIYWEAASVQGLRRTGGVGPWSDAVTEVARHIRENYPNREILVLDWGLAQNLYVLTDGELRSREVFWGASRERDWEGRPWSERIREGGVYLLTGPENHLFPGVAVIAGFERALEEVRPVIAKRRRFLERRGVTYAEIIEIEAEKDAGAGGDGGGR